MGFFIKFRTLRIVKKKVKYKHSFISSTRKNKKQNIMKKNSTLNRTVSIKIDAFRITYFIIIFV